jgi:autotransporter-associated beta strand protein
MTTKNLPAVLVAAFAFLLISLAPSHAQVTDPKITSWVTARSYARVYTTAANRTSGTSATTWSGTTSPFYSDIQRVVYSNSYVYLYATGMPSYIAGNWLTPNGAQYNFWPVNRAAIHRVPRTITIPTTKQKNNGSGGVLVNGVFVWANGDAQSYDNTGAPNATTATIAMTGDAIWNRLAGQAEEFNFDPGKGHHPPSGAYHNHVNPIALRYQLGDHVTYNATTKTYAEGSGSPTAHSPLIGFANDGIPIYGPYGYGTATDANSTVRRMTSGFAKRDGTTTNLTTGLPNTNISASGGSTGRTTLPVWAASVQGKSTTLAATEYGPRSDATYANGPVNVTCNIGIFAEDYDYLGDLGYTQGTHFDLNRQNVRWCVTPEYPSGTYAYFVCINADGTTNFPDVINQEYFGTAATGQGTVTSITETVTEFEKGGQASPLTLTAAASGANVILTWPSVEGATYTAAYSNDGTNYTTLSSTLTGTLGATATYTTSTVAAYYKITMTALATYNTSGNGGVTGLNTFATTTYSLPNTAPTLTNIDNLSARGGAGVAQSVTYASLAAVANEFDADGNAISFRVESVVNGSLTKNGIAVTAGSTLLSSGETWVWTPAANAAGNTAAFTVKAWDGSLASTTALNVTFAVNRAPLLTSFQDISTTEDVAATIPYATFAANANEQDDDGDAVSFRIESVVSGTLTKNGTAITPGVTLVSSGESLVWTPAANVNGSLAAFTMRAWDGDLASASAVTAYANVTSVNDAPTLTTFTTLTGGTEDEAYGIHMSQFESNSNFADVDGPSSGFRIASVLAGTLTKGGVAVTPGVTTITEGENVLWTPPANANGSIAAFTITGWDGLLASSPAVTVNIQLAAVSDGAIWDATAGTGSWSTATNWLDDTVPLSTDTVQFTGASPTAISLENNRTAAGVSFSGNSAYTLSGHTLTLASGSTLLTTSPSSGSITHTIASALAPSADFNINASTSTTLALNGGLSGSGALSKLGSGTALIAGTNTFSGNVDVQAGTLQIGDGNVLGSIASPAINIASGASLIHHIRAYNQNIDTNFTGDGSVTFRDSADYSVQYNGTATHTGGTTLDNINLLIGSGGSTGSITGTITLLNDAEMYLERGSASTLSNTITGSGIFGHFGNGALTLTAPLNVTSLRAGGEGSLSLGSSVTATEGILGFSVSNQTTASGSAAQLSFSELTIAIASTASLTLSGGADMTTGSLILGYEASDTGSLSLSGSATSATVTTALTGTATSTITLNNLSTLTTPVFGNVTTHLNNSTLVFSKGGTHTAPIAVTGGLAHIQCANNITLSGAISGSGSLTKSGTGTLTLGSSHTRTGNTTITGGILRLTAPVLGTSSKLGILAGSTLNLDFSGTQTISTLQLGNINQFPGTHGSLTSTATYKTAQITGDGILIVTSSNMSFGDWAILSGLDGTAGKENGENDDPDSDGVSNVMEFILGGLPLSNNSAILPTASRVGDDFVFTFQRSDLSEYDRVLNVQVTHDLTTWTNIAIQSASSTSGTATVSIAENGSASDTITVTVPQGTQTKCFGRLAAEED